MDVQVVEVPDRARFEARDGDDLVGYIDYTLEDDELVLVHTKVEREGLGVGSRLAKGTLDVLLADGRAFSITCPFVKGWVRRHPDYLHRVSLHG